MNGIVPSSFYPFSSNLTGIISTNTVRIPLPLIVAKTYLTYLQYRTEDVPWYTPGHAVTLSLVVVGLASAIGLHILLRRENACRDRGERDEVIGDSKGGDLKNGCYESVEAAKKDKGDGWSGYRYIT